MMLDYEDCLCPAFNPESTDPLDWSLEDRPVIYVAAFYSANPAHGLTTAADAYAMLFERGWIPMVPHTTFLLDALYPNTPEHWYAYDKALLKRCDAMYVCGDHTTAHSAGVLEEIAYATKHDIPVFYDIIDAKDRYSR